LTFAVGVALYGAGWWRLSVVDAEDRAATEHVRVGLVQADVGSTAKRQGERHDREIEAANQRAYEEVTGKAAERGAHLIRWPEAALSEGLKVWDARTNHPLPKAFVDSQLVNSRNGYLVELGKDHTLLLGGYTDEDRPGGRVRFNSAVLREAGEEELSLYRKL